MMSSGKKTSAIKMSSTERHEKNAVEYGSKAGKWCYTSECEKSGCEKAKECRQTGDQERNWSEAQTDFKEEENKSIAQKERVEKAVSINGAKEVCDKSRKVANNPFSQPWEDSNLVLVVEGVKFHVHRLILSLHSPIFNAMLKSEFKEATSAEITLPEKDADEILDLLKQLYPQEREEITMQNVERLLKLAEEYQVKTVFDLCANCLSKEPKTEANAMRILLLAQKYRLRNVGDDCLNVLAKLNLQKLERYREFSDLNSENLRAILLPRMRRLEDAVKELSPQVSGIVAFAMWLWSQTKKDMAWCPVHIPNGKPRVSVRECLQTCPVCKKVIESMASKTSWEDQYTESKRHWKQPSSYAYVYTDYSNDHFDSNFNTVVKKLFDLID